MILTQKLGKKVWLAVVLGGNGDSVEEHEHDDEPIKPLGFHRVPDPKP